MKETVKSKIERLSKHKNPFTINYHLLVKAFSPENNYKIEDGLKLPVHIDIEYYPQVKWNKTTTHKQGILTLEPISIKVLMWISMSLQYNHDIIYINRKRVMEECNLSKPTVVKAMTELQTKGFIIYSGIRSLYWINPEYFFAGNRIKKYSENIKHK